MELKIYLPYFDYNDGDFDVSNEYYKTKNDYIEALNSSHRQTSKEVANAMTNVYLDGNISGTRNTNQTYRFANKKDETKISYSFCEGILLDENGKNVDVDKFIEDYVTQSPQVYIIKLNRNTSEEEFEQELNVWLEEHSKIKSFSKFKDDEWVFENEPVRDVKVSFKNNADETKTFVLSKCRVMDLSPNDTYTILTDKIQITDN